MSRFKTPLLLMIVATFFFILGGLFFPKISINIKNSPPPKVEGTEISSSSTPTDFQDLVRVTRIIDGDTIEIQGGKRVRLIGIDTPEPNKTGEVGCYGHEAADYLTKLLNGQTVKIEKDVSEVDRYNRLLRYIYLGDIFVNDKLVRDGIARVYTYPPDVEYKDKFLESEKFARENNLGLWKKCNNTSILYSIEVSPSSTSSDNKEITGQSSIVCSSNTYNCSDFKTQAEAQNVFDYCMKTVGFDVHKLDRDSDGRVCETLP